MPTENTSSASYARCNLKSTTARACLMRAVCAALVAWLVSAGTVVADPPSYEFWPEIDTWLRLSPAWRLSLFVPISKNLETHYREGNLIPQVDYAFGTSRLKRRMIDEERSRNIKVFLSRGGYLGGRSLSDHGDEYTERTVFAELHARVPIKGGLLISHRLRSDFRWLGDHDPEFSTRWRYRLMVEREFTTGRWSLVPYVNVEPYYDSRYATVNRLRLIAGSSMARSPRTALEVNGTYQYDSHSSARELLALNVILHLFFDTSRSAVTPSTGQGSWRTRVE